MKDEPTELSLSGGVYYVEAANNEEKAIILESCYIQYQSLTKADLLALLAKHVELYPDFDL